MPERAFYGWKLLAAFWLIVFFNLGFAAYGAPLINTAMAADLEFNRTMLGLPVSVFMLASGLPGPLVALCVNRRGVRFTLVLGSLLMVAGAVMLALFVNNVVGAAIGYGVLMGLGVAAGATLPAQTGVAFWFQRKRARALAILLAAVGVGGFVAPSLLNAVMASFGGWRAGWWVFALASGLAMVIALLFVKERPSDLGQFPDGLPPEATEAGDCASTAKRRVYVTSEAWAFREAIRSPALWLLLGCMIGLSLGYTLVISHAIAHLQDLGHSQAAAGFSLSVLAVASLAGHFIVGTLGDRIDPRYLWSGALATFGVGLLVLLNASAALALYVYAACIGIGWGISLTCLMALLANYFGTKAYALLVGVTLAVQPTVSSLSPSIAGRLYDQYGSYDLSIYPIATLCFVSALVLTWLRPPVRRESSGVAAQSAAQ